MRRIVSLTALIALIGAVFTACAPATAPGEKDRERGEDAINQLPK